MERSVLDYFKSSIDYPSFKSDRILPYGEMWNYVSSTFLNGFINYVEHKKCIVLDRYTGPDEDVSEKILVHEKGSFGDWKKWKGTKSELINSINSGEKGIYHTSLDCFNDDVIILSKIENSEESSENKYMLFWFDMDCSDCCIGRFKTEDSEEIVQKSLITWINSLECHKSYSELDPKKFLKGWVKF